VGHIFDAVVIVDNFGAGFSGSYHIGVYLSQDALFGPGDTLLASTDHQGLAAYKDLFWGIQGTRLSGYKSNRTNWLAESSKSARESEG
jgi:hypothetical protein